MNLLRLTKQEEKKKSKLDMSLSKMKIHNLTVTHLYLRIQKLTSGK